MPIQCEIAFPNVGTDEMRAIDFNVMKDVFSTQNELGCLADESVYQCELSRRLRLSGIAAELEVPIVLSFRDLTITLKLDMIVLRKVIYELKTVSALNSKHEGQLLSYLYLANASRGKLLNFRPRSVKSRFVNAAISPSERRRFQCDESGFDRSCDLRELLVELVGDWGTGLDASLYRRAILHSCCSLPEEEHLLPMTCGGELVGRQRFHLLDGETALGITTYKECKPENYQDLEKLIAFSKLKRIHWINITHHNVLLTTIHRPK